MPSSTPQEMSMSALRRVSFGQQQAEEDGPFGATFSSPASVTFGAGRGDFARRRSSAATCSMGGDDGNCDDDDRSQLASSFALLRGGVAPANKAGQETAVCVGGRPIRRAPLTPEERFLCRDGFDDHADRLNSFSILHSALESIRVLYDFDEFKELATAIGYIDGTNATLEVWVALTEVFKWLQVQRERREHRETLQSVFSASQEEFGAPRATAASPFAALLEDWAPEDAAEAREAAQCILDAVGLYTPPPPSDEDESNNAATDAGAAGNVQQQQLGGRRRSVVVVGGPGGTTTNTGGSTGSAAGGARRSDVVEYLVHFGISKGVVEELIEVVAPSPQSTDPALLAAVSAITGVPGTVTPGGGGSTVSGGVTPADASMFISFDHDPSGASTAAMASSGFMGSTSGGLLGGSTSLSTSVGGGGGGGRAGGGRRRSSAPAAVLVVQVLTLHDLEKVMMLLQCVEDSITGEDDAHDDDGSSAEEGGGSSHCPQSSSDDSHLRFASATVGNSSNNKRGLHPQLVGGKHGASPRRSNARATMMRRRQTHLASILVGSSSSGGPGASAAAAQRLASVLGPRAALGSQAFSSASGPLAGHSAALLGDTPLSAGDVGSSGDVGNAAASLQQALQRLHFSGGAGSSSDGGGTTSETSSSPAAAAARGGKPSREGKRKPRAGDDKIKAAIDNVFKKKTKAQAGAVDESYAAMMRDTTTSPRKHHRSVTPRKSARDRADAEEDDDEETDEDEEDEEEDDGVDFEEELRKADEEAERLKREKDKAAVAARYLGGNKAAKNNTKATLAFIKSMQKSPEVRSSIRKIILAKRRQEGRVEPYTYSNAGNHQTLLGRYSSMEARLVESSQSRAQIECQTPQCRARSLGVAAAKEGLALPEHVINGFAEKDVDRLRKELHLVDEDDESDDENLLVDPTVKENDDHPTSHRQQVFVSTTTPTKKHVVFAQKEQQQPHDDDDGHPDATGSASTSPPSYAAGSGAVTPTSSSLKSPSATHPIAPSSITPSANSPGGKTSDRGRLATTISSRRSKEQEIAVAKSLDRLLAASPMSMMMVSSPPAGGATPQAKRPQQQLPPLRQQDLEAAAAAGAGGQSQTTTPMLSTRSSLDRWTRHTPSRHHHHQQASSSSSPASRSNISVKRKR